MKPQQHVKRKVWDNLRYGRAPEQTGGERYFADLMNKFRILNLVYLLKEAKPDFIF